MLGPPFGTTSLSSSRKTWTHILFSRAGNKTVEYIIENLPSYVNSLKFKKKSWFVNIDEYISTSYK
jgi:hypothetical protein